MLKRLIRRKVVLPVEQPPNLQFLKEVPLIRLILSPYGYFLARTSGAKSVLKVILWILLTLTSVVRIVRFSVLDHPRSLFLIAGYIAEILALCHHFLVIAKGNSMHKFFTSFQLQLNSLKVQRSEYKNHIRALDIAYFIQATTLAVLVFEFLFRNVLSKEKFHIYLPFLTFYEIMLNNWIAVSCALYALALLAHFIRCDIELKNFKLMLRQRGCVSHNEVLSLIRNLNEIHSKFEKTFAFMPFFWLTYCWCQANIYMMSSTFGFMRAYFDISLFVWGIIIQVTTFSTIRLIIFINSKLTSQCSSVVVALEETLDRVGLNANKLTYSLEKMEKLSQMRFTAWGYYLLEKSLVFSYLASMISFSVLTLQLDAVNASKETGQN